MYGLPCVQFQDNISVLYYSQLKEQSMNKLIKSNKVECFCPHCKKLHECVEEVVGLWHFLICPINDKMIAQFKEVKGGTVKD